MKKPFRTTIDETAILFDTVIFSAGRIGAQVEVNPEDLSHMVDLQFVDIVVDR